MPSSSSWPVWVGWLIFLVVSFGVFEAWALVTNRWTLSRTVWQITAGWPPFGWLCGLIVGFLAAHLFWPGEGCQIYHAAEQLFGIASAHAQTSSAAGSGPSPVSVPIGDWIASVLGWARDGMIALAMAVVARYVPAPLRQYLTNQVLAKAVDYAIAAVDGAEKGKTLDLPVTSAVLTVAEKYVIASAPGLAARLGPILRSMLLARVSAATPVAANVTATDLAAALPIK